MENIGLGTVIELEFNASQEIHTRTDTISGISLTTGQSNKVELTMAFPFIEGIHEDSCFIEYYDLLRDKYKQEIHFGTYIEKDKENENMQIISVGPPKYVE